MAIDQGTTSTRALLYNREAIVVASAQIEIKQIFAHVGWVEQDANEIWLSVCNVMNEVMDKMNITLDHIDSVGITNQRETTILWNKKTGQPIYKAIVWQSRQTVDIVNQWKEQGIGDVVRKKTGLPIDSYFSASKIKWILENKKTSNLQIDEEDIIFGTVDTWLLWNLTNGKIHSTDYTNASRTMLYNIFEKKWDLELLELFGIEESMLPNVKMSSSGFGRIENNKYFRGSTNVCGIAGDQQAALYGQMCWEKGELKNTYGTGCFLLMNVGNEEIISKHGLITTLACNEDGEVCYCLEGSVFVGGSAIQWLRDGLRIIDRASESENLAKSIASNEGVYFVPAFVGLGAPYWDDEVRGTIFGLTRGTSKVQIARATLEAIAYQTKDVVNAMEEEVGQKLINIKVDGGATSNAFLMQFQSNVLNQDVFKAIDFETTALGVAMLAGKVTGFYNISELSKVLKKRYQTFRPENTLECTHSYNRWKSAVNVSRTFYHE